MHYSITSIVWLALLASFSASAATPCPVSQSEARCGIVRLITEQTASPNADSKQRSTTSTGLASYYSDSFNGELTASGKTFHNSDLVAAHPTYPFGTLVRVTRLDNHKSVDVQIIDRGPFGTNRKKGVVIDLSRAAADKLDMLEKGLARVRLKVLKWGQDENGESSAATAGSPVTLRRDVDTLYDTVD